MRFRSSPMAARRLRNCSALRPASTRIRVFSVASSAAFPLLPLARTQNLTMGRLLSRTLRIHPRWQKQNNSGMFWRGCGTFADMKAARIHQHGGPEALVVEDVAEPKLRADQVLVRVRA